MLCPKFLELTRQKIIEHLFTYSSDRLVSYDLYSIWFTNIG
jgi:hypothetical protein